MELKYEILRTSQQKAEGLQHRSSLDPNTILVFPGIQQNDWFHSSNCRFNFDIAFLDKENRILKARTVYPPDEYIKAPDDTCLAIEAVAGFLNARGLKVGDQLEIPNE